MFHLKTKVLDFEPFEDCMRMTKVYETTEKSKVSTFFGQLCFQQNKMAYFTWLKSSIIFTSPFISL